MKDVNYYQLASIICNQVEKKYDNQETTDVTVEGLLSFLNPIEAPYFGVDSIDKVASEMQKDGAEIIKYKNQWMLESSFDKTKFDSFASDIYGSMFELLMITLDDTSQVNIEKYHSFTIENPNKVILKEDYLVELIQDQRNLLV